MSEREKQIVERLRRAERIQQRIYNRREYGRDSIPADWEQLREHARHASGRVIRKRLPQ